MPDQPRRFGWIRDLPDQRDHLYAAPPARLQQLPPKVDLTAQCPDVYDQGDLGSCTANAIAAAHEFDQTKQKLPAPSPFVPSRLFIYYNERAIEHSVASDSGAQIRDGIKSISKQGVCPEAEWPYDITNFTEKPSQQAFLDARSHQAISYQRLVQSLNQMKGCLADGYPFVYGFVVYESFPMQGNGDVPMPGPNEGGPNGGPPAGHAVLAVGYDDAQQRFIFRNSWGTSWGREGYGTMPYEYLTRADLSSDLWTIRLVK